MNSPLDCSAEQGSAGDGGPPVLKVTNDLAEERRNWVSPQPACSQGSPVLHPGPHLLCCQLLPVGRGGPPVSPTRVSGPLPLPVRESGGPLQPRQERPHLPALSPGTFSAPWAALARSREQYCLAWEAKYLMELGNALETILSGLANMVAQEALKYTVLSGEPPLSPASGMPTTPKATLVLCPCLPEAPRESGTVPAPR